MKDVSSEKPLKILEVIPALNSGGAERFVVDLCNQMARDECDVADDEELFLTEFRLL